MKREDKREEAAYLNVIDVCGCGNCPRADDCQLSFSLMCNKGKAYIRGFMAGSDWSDENQLSVIRGGKTNTIIWHDASEEPTYNYAPFLYQDTCGVFWLTTRKSVNSDWKYFVEENFVSHWAYVSDLLPKGGEK